MRCGECVELLHHGLGLEPTARETRWVGDLHHLLASILRPHRERTRIAIRCTRIPRAVVDDLEPRHQGADLRIVPALAVELGKPELTVDERDGSQKIEAVVGGFARSRLDPAGILLLPTQSLSRRPVNRSTAPRSRRCISTPAATTLCPVARQGKALTLAAMM